MQNINKGIRYAIAYDQGKVGQHFGKSKAFLIVDIDNSAVIQKAVLEVQEAGHSKLAGLLESNAVDVVVCGGIGNPAIEALKEKHMTCIRGVSGQIEHVIKELEVSSLRDDPNHTCNHHHGEEGHACKGHACHE